MNILSSAWGAHGKIFLPRHHRCLAFQNREGWSILSCDGRNKNVIQPPDDIAILRQPRWGCYHCRMFNFGKPKTVGDWIVHIAGAIVAIFLVWWMLRTYVL